MKKILSIALLALLAIGAANAQTADAIAKKYVDAIGGTAKWKAMKSMKQGIVFSTQGIDITGTVIADASNRARVDMTAMGSKIVQAHDGTTAWWINPFAGATTATKMPEMEKASFMAQEFLDQMIDWKKRGSSIELQGDKVIGETDCYILKLVRKNQTETLYYISKENSLLVMSSEKSAAMGNQVAESYYTDYDEHDGLMIAGTVTVKVGGVVANTTKVNSVAFNVAVNDDMFAFPGN